VLWLVRASLTGSAPILRKLARSCAEPIVKLPEIWAPVRPSIPCGLSMKLMIGWVTIWLSRTTEKCCEYCSAAAELKVPGGAVALPRSAIVRVTSSNAVRPVSVKSNVTLGWLVVGSKFCSGFVMSVPESAGRSRSTYWGCEESSAGLWERVFVSLVGASTTTVPCGTETILVPGGCFSLRVLRKRSCFFSAGPEISFLDLASNR
jgi:hypothetical protein